MDFLQVCHFHDSRVLFWEKRGCRNVEITLRLTVKITWRIPNAKYLIKPMEMKTFEPKSKKGSKMIKKHYLEKVFGTPFKNVKKPYKTNGNRVFQNAKTRCEKPYKTC